MTWASKGPGGGSDQRQTAGGERGTIVAGAGRKEGGKGQERSYKVDSHSAQLSTILSTPTIITHVSIHPNS
jgi:hypothetical protein